MDNCPQAEVCGGCAYRGVPYEEQLAEKSKAVLGFLGKNGVPAEAYRGIHAAPSTDAYRNKMEYSFGDEVKGGPLTLGLHKKGSYMAVIDTPGCRIVPEDFNRIRDAVLLWARARGHGFYHKKDHNGFLRNLVIRRGERTGELLVNLVTSSEETMDEDAFKDLIFGVDTEDTITGVLHTVSDRKADAVIKDNVKILYGRDHYFEEMLGLRFRVGAFSFFQTNTAAVERMLRDALNEFVPGRATGMTPAARMPEESVNEFDTKCDSGIVPAALSVRTDLSASPESIPWHTDCSLLCDVYCGTGTISLALSSAAERVIGIELVPDSVESARENARLNGVSNCEFRCGDALEQMEMLSEAGLRPDLAVVDPPRMGLHPKALKKLLTFGLPRVLYLSCNPKTFAENMAVMQAAGYSLETLDAYDNFPFTKHIELAAVIWK